MGLRAHAHVVAFSDACAGARALFQIEIGTDHGARVALQMTCEDETHALVRCKFSRIFRRSHHFHARKMADSQGNAFEIAAHGRGHNLQPADYFKFY